MALFFAWPSTKKIYKYTKKILKMTADAVAITGGRFCDTQEFVLVVYFVVTIR